jgi:Flp pilus assembly CpaF family ATPase
MSARLTEPGGEIALASPIAHLIQDPDVSEIMVNGGGRVFLERQGQLEEAEDVHVEDDRRRRFGAAGRRFVKGRIELTGG